MPMFLWLPTESAAFIRPISQCRRIDRFAPNRSTKADAWLGQSWVILDRIGLSRHVRFPPVSEHGANIAGCLKRAIGGHDPHHSITLSAAVSKVGGTVRPSALAALRLMTSSKIVGCWIGRSAGFVPLRTFPT